MKTLARCLSRLYPRWWRRRYGGELDAFIEDSPLALRDLPALAVHAVRMHFLKGEIQHMQEPAIRLVSLGHAEVPNGYEVETVIEQPLPAGGAALVRRYFREVDFGAAYVTLLHQSRDGQPPETSIVYGVKGPVDGSFRTDTTEMILLDAGGGVRRSSQTVKTWLPHQAIREKFAAAYRAGRDAGLTPDQIFQRLRQE